MTGLLAKAQLGVPTGTPLRPYAGEWRPGWAWMEIAGDDLTLDGVDLTSPDPTRPTVQFTGRNVTLTRCRVPVGQLFLNGSGRHVITDCETGAGISASPGGDDDLALTVQRYRKLLVTSDDGIHIGHYLASDGTVRGRLRDALLEDVWVDGFDFPSSSDAHGDGLQVRGVEGLTIRRAVFDLGAWQSQKNAAVYAENVGGGSNGLLLEDVWLNGGGIPLYVTATGVARRVHIGPDAHWRPTQIDGGLVMESSDRTWPPPAATPTDSTMPAAPATQPSWWPQLTTTMRATLRRWLKVRKVDTTNWRP